MAEIEETVDDGSDCDDLVEEAYAYFVSKKYPECVSETKKRVIRRKAAKLTISVEGELLYKHKQGKEKSLEERQKILLACHIDSTSGHMGKTRTLYRIKERFMWHGMVKDVVSLLSKCDVCQRMNRKLTTGVPELHPIPVKAPWYMVGIDFIGPLSPVAKDGSRYILTISDYFTKWVEVIFMRMGLPLVMLSDNGSEFCNALNDQLSEMLGIKRRLTTPYHPQLTPSGTLASPHSSEDDSDCHKGGQSTVKTIHHPVIVPIKMTVLKSVAIDSGCTVLEDCSVSVKRDTIRKRKCPFTCEMKKQVVGGEWLTDDHMFYAQELLRMQFPTSDGWQSTLLAQNNGYLPAKMNAIQIHIVSDSHWVTSARLGGTVTLCDCRKVGSLISSTLTHQLCQVYRTSICDSAGNSFLAVNFATVQKQRGSDDCGFFAIAFALHAALGHCLEEIEFDQATMRDHLLKCYTTRNFTPFPTKKAIETGIRVEPVPIWINPAPHAGGGKTSTGAKSLLILDDALWVGRGMDDIIIIDISRGPSHAREGVGQTGHVRLQEVREQVPQKISGGGGAVRCIVSVVGSQRPLRCLSLEFWS
ncbi:hypothetical protein EMCRGX_G007571 [Ephydatia muelleri]